MSETVQTMALKPFAVGPWRVGRDEIKTAVDRLANLPARFQSFNLASALIPGEPIHVQMEAANRLMQRWRKLGLCEFKGARWSLTPGAWGKLQAAAFV